MRVPPITELLFQLYIADDVGIGECARYSAKTLRIRAIWPGVNSFLQKLSDKVRCALREKVGSQGSVLWRISHMVMYRVSTRLVWAAILLFRTAHLVEERIEMSWCVF